MLRLLRIGWRRAVGGIAGNTTAGGTTLIGRPISPMGGEIKTRGKQDYLKNQKDHRLRNHLEPSNAIAADSPPPPLMSRNLGRRLLGHHSLSLSPMKNGEEYASFSVTKQTLAGDPTHLCQVRERGRG